MSSPRIEKPDLPEYMTWEELERLPDEVAGQIELWAGRVVWLRRGPAEHQRFTRRLESPYQDIRAADTLLVGEVLSPSNTQSDVEAKKSRYAGAGIPWYWEVALAADDSTIATIRAYALQTGAAQLPDGVHPLHPTNYLLVGEWTPADEDGVLIDFPFLIRIGWPELAF